MRLPDLVELVRAPAALSVPGDLLAGASAAGVLDRRTAALASASVCLYWAGMAANDWADRDIDAVERPERPIPSGRISAHAALGVAIGLTAAGVAIAGKAAGARGLAVAVPLVASIWAYDLRAKNTAAGPALMATCRALDVLLGASTGHPRAAASAAAAIGAHTYTVTALSRQEVSGGRPGLAAATLAATVGLAAAVAARGATPGGTPAAVTRVLASVYALRYGRAQARILSGSAAPRVRAAVVAGIVELPTLQGALTSRAGSTLAGLAVAAVAPLARRLARKVSPT
jgi:4-hydroxybenzoate polyprenyltransferase